LSEPILNREVGYIVDCHALDKFVAIYLEPYGQTWRALDTGSDGYHNGSYEKAEVELGAEIEDDLDQDFSRWLMGEGPFYKDEDDTYSYDLPGVQHMLQWLCNIGKIPSGTYLVELWW